MSRKKAGRGSPLSCKNIVRATMSINESIQGLGYDDLFQTGCEALCHAALHYRADRGATFATFADVVIKNRLLSHCRKITRLQAPILYLDAPSAEYPNLPLRIPFRKRMTAPYPILKPFTCLRRQVNITMEFPKRHRSIAAKMPGTYRRGDCPLLRCKAQPRCGMDFAGCK